MLGQVFDHKIFVENYRKIQQEFVKRINIEIPFHYWTGVNEKFNVGPTKSFNEPTDGKIERLDRISISRRADPGMFVANRVSLPQRGSLRGSPCKNRKITEFLHTFCVEEVIHKMNKKR